MCMTLYGQRHASCPVQCQDDRCYLNLFSEGSHLHPWSLLNRGRIAFKLTQYLSGQ